MADTVIVGRVAVRVLPDTDGFRRQLQREIKEQTSGVDATVPVDADLQAQDLEEKLKAKVEELSDKFAVRIQTTLENLRRKVAETTKVAEAQSKLNPIKMSTTIDGTVNVSEEAVLNNVKRLMGKLKGFWQKIKVSVGTDLDQASLAKTKAGLEIWFMRLKVMTQRVKVVLDKKSVKGVATGLAALSGARLFKDLVSLEPFKHLDEQLPKIALMSTLLGQGASYLISMSSNMLSLSRSVTQIGLGAVALPGIFMGAAVSMFTLGSAFKDMKKVMPEMSKAWANLRAQISHDFWSKAKKPVKTFFSDMMGGLKTTGKSMGSFTGKLMSAFHTIVSPSLPRYFGALSKSFGIIGKSSPAIANIVKLFGDMGAVATPRLAKWAARMTEQFSAWMTMKGESGLTAMLDTSVQRMHQLWDVVAGTWNMFKGLSRAAEVAGGTTLASLGAAMRHMEVVVNDPTFQKRLVNVFSSARIAIERMVAIAGPSMKKPPSSSISLRLVSDWSTSSSPCVPHWTRSPPPSLT
jgi:hypothetical protein